jgi:hypothetical protein
MAIGHAVTARLMIMRRSLLQSMFQLYISTMLLPRDISVIVIKK